MEETVSYSMPASMSEPEAEPERYHSEPADRSRLAEPLPFALLRIGSKAAMTEQLLYAPLIFIIPRITASRRKTLSGATNDGAAVDSALFYWGMSVCYAGNSFYADMNTRGIGSSFKSLGDTTLIISSSGLSHAA